jgi:cell division protein FtsZ|tara:strand:- start:1144 stop:2247 length:1104 start_codon:yes stop_codon:yes gene_type:complete
MDFLVKNAIDRPEEKTSPLGAMNANIVVVGAGGAGNNSITRLTNMGGIKGAKSVVVNTDAQHLDISKADKKLLIGYQETKGLGAGGFPEVGRTAAEASKNEIKELVKDANLVFLTCGLGGGTGTGSLPVVAEIARNAGAIVVATVTTPFDLEKARLLKAEEGLIELREHCDTVIVVDNNKLLEYVPQLPVNQAFGVADELIATMMKGISETITVPSLMNLDYADVKSIMTGGGVAMIGVGEAEGKNKVEEAVHDAMNHPLLDVDYRGASGALIHITGGPSMTLSEVTDAGDAISGALDPSAQVIWGARVDPEMEGKIRVMNIITGVKSPNILGKRLSIADTVGNSAKTNVNVKQPPMMKELSIDYIS